MKYILLFLVLLLGGKNLNSQNLCGKVLNQDKEELPFLQINHIRTGNHTHTNENGDFCIGSLTHGDSLLITGEGFVSYYFKYDSLTSEINILLESSRISLEAFSVSAQKETQEFISRLDISANPVNSSQEFLEQVPGLFIGQHAGGGKAEQIFIRGFDVDHGTDVAISFDGMPINMVSHAHGQGYADMHFIMPEVMKEISFNKGAYRASEGNFNTAASAKLNSYSLLPHNEVKLSVGQFNTRRVYTGLNLLNVSRHNLIVAGSILQTDGPFESSQNFDRKNYFLKYSGQLNDENYLSASFSGFSSSWDASGQIPRRAVNSGLISRFGAIDDTEGGLTNRHNLILNHTHDLGNSSQVKSTIYAGSYNFQLFSNFTFFLEDSLNGDQIMQRENRNFYGYQSIYSKRMALEKSSLSYSIGLGFRNDDIRNNELSHTKNRNEILEVLQLGDINESNYFSFASLSYKRGKWVLSPGIRADVFYYRYQDKLVEEYVVNNNQELLFSPKLKLDYRFNNSFGTYLNLGKGFHSNDSRRATQNISGNPTPASWGADLGVNWKPTRKMFINTTFWGLLLEQEFVYVGDAGIVEPSGKTRRMGVDFMLRYEPIDNLQFKADVNYAYARALDNEAYTIYIPLAPELTMVYALSYRHKSGVYAGVYSRYMGDRSADEYYSITAKGYTVFDANVGWEKSNVNILFSCENIFDVEWEETQFATLSRLKNESAPVEEIHFTPGTPFRLRFSISYTF